MPSFQQESSARKDVHVHFSTPAALTSVLLAVTLFGAVSLKSYGQCNTTLNKLLPTGSINNEDRFGSALAANGQYMVVAAEDSDTLGILYAGAAYVYEKTAAGWAYRALLTASDPDEYDFFGNQVAIDASGNTIVVINRSYEQGGVYIFEKPASGWQTMTETHNVKVPIYFEFNSSMALSDDGSNVAITNPNTDEQQFYVVSKSADGTWSAIDIIQAPNPHQNKRLGIDILFHQDYVYVTADNDETGSGIYVYRKNGGVYQYLAKLTASVSIHYMAYFGASIAAHGDLIAVSGAVYEPENAGQTLFIFKKTGEWANASETSKFKLPFEFTYKSELPAQFLSSTQLTVAALVRESDYYTGKIFALTAPDDSWSSVNAEVVFQEEGLFTPSEFANEVVWTGSELLMSVSMKSVGDHRRFSVLSLTLSGSIWGSLQQVILPRVTSANVNFGVCTIASGEELLSGAPFDGTSGRRAGAVYVYARSGDEYVRVNTILPSTRRITPNGKSDSGFGYSLATFGNDLAVGAPWYRYGESVLGKIFLYKRTNDSWTTATLFDSLTVPEALELTHVGQALAMNDKVLFASAYNNFNNEHTNAIIVFEKSNDEWIFRQLIKHGKPLNKSDPTLTFSLNGDDLAVGDPFSVNGGLFIYSRNPASGLWEQKFSASSGVYSGFGGAVKLMDNHLFVGLPGYPSNNVYRSGAVAVYVKMPGTAWEFNMQPSAIISAKVPIDAGYFGSTLDVVGNTLAVGAPGMFLTAESGVRTIPGDCYVIQARDYFWTNTIEFMNLHGDRHNTQERDHFGASVMIDEEYFYVGARSENTSTGMFSGAVYYIPTPPVIFLQPPVCLSEAPFFLEAYPADGVWSGAGIDDSGKFDPALAGEGTIELTYTTPNCHFQGTVQLEVKPPRTMERVSPEQVIKCSEDVIALELAPIDGLVFYWYYKPDGEDDFVLLGSGGSTYMATNPGEYKAKIVELCVSESPSFYVTLENFTTSTGPQPVVCSPTDLVSLVARHDTGTWEGVGVVGDRFDPDGLSNGYYKLTYYLTTPTGCDISLIDSIKVSIVEPMIITRGDDHYCETGAITLKAEPDDPGLSYTWNYSESPGSTLSRIDQDLDATAIVYAPGFYQVWATNGECSNHSDTTAVGVDGLGHVFSAAEISPIVICNDPQYVLTVQSRPGTTFTWLYMPADGDSFNDLSQGEQGELIATEAGVYKVKGEYGFCTFESDTATLTFTSDDLFVPNVFTPNGDDNNAVFETRGMFDISYLSISNRYGKQVFSTDTGVWDGADAPAGAYYWYIRYTGCGEKERELKGWVQLVR